MLNATLWLHLRNHDSDDVSKDIEKNLYAGNIVSGCLSKEDAIRNFKEAKAIMLEANFNLRSWVSNSPQLQAVVQEEKQTRWSTFWVSAGMYPQTEYISLQGQFEFRCYQEESLTTILQNLWSFGFSLPSHYTC